MFLCKCRILPFNTSLHLHKNSFFESIPVLPFSTSTPKISIFDYLVNRHHFSLKSAGNAASSSDTQFVINPKNADSVLNFLNQSGFSKNQIESVVQKSPWVLSANVDSTIKPKIKVFQDIGLKSVDSAQIISASLSLLNIPTDKILQSVLTLKSVLGPNADISRFLKNSWTGKILAFDLNKTLLPNIEYLKSCGICPLQISRNFCYYPLTFLVNQEKLKGLVKRVDETGIEKDSNNFLEAVRVMSSMSRHSWEIKLKRLRELGFSDKNIEFVFKKQPLAFGVSDGKIEEIVEFLLNVGNLGINDIVSHPELLTYSVEKRLKPRVRVLKVIESKDLAKRKHGLVKCLKMSDAEFRKMFVNPYLKDGVGDLYATRQGLEPKDSA